MTFGDEIREYQATLGREGRQALQWVLDKMSERGRAAGLLAKNKTRGDSKHYARLANKRWKN